MTRPTLTLKLKDGELPQALQEARLRHAPKPTSPKGVKPDLAALRARFPDLDTCKPMVTGIHYKIAKAMGWSLNRTGKVMHRITGSKAYQQALAKEGSMRHGLDGQPVGPVSAPHREYARAGLERQ